MHGQKHDDDPDQDLPLLTVYKLDDFRMIKQQQFNLLLLFITKIMISNHHSIQGEAVSQKEVEGGGGGCGEREKIRRRRRKKKKKATNTEKRIEKRK